MWRPDNYDDVLKNFSITSNELDALQIYVQAMRFHHCNFVLYSVAFARWPGLALHDDPKVDPTILSEQKPPELMVGVVLNALCAELFLKAILCLEGIAYKNIHDLDKFFLALPPEWQDRIRKHYKIEISENPSPFGNLPADVLDLLAINAKALTVWRYTYEFPPRHSYVSYVRSAIARAINEVKPNWHLIAFHHNNPPQRPTQIEIAPGVMLTLILPA